MSFVKKNFPALTLLALASLWLAACASEQPATAMPTATVAANPVMMGTPDVNATADPSLSVENSGSAKVREYGGLQGLQLRSQPDQTSAILGYLKPGEEGKVLGLTADGVWVLVQFKELTGWVPAFGVDLILVR